MRSDHKRCLVIGLGNRFRSDDGVGLEVVSELRERELPVWMEVVDGGMDELGLIEHLRTADSAVIVDAVSVGEAPGTIRTFLVDDACPIPAVRNLGLHGFGLPEAIGIAARLGTLPRMAVVGVQPESTAPGEGLSRSVESRVPDLVEAALQAVIWITSRRHWPRSQERSETSSGCRASGGSNLIPCPSSSLL
jgi:hydrogenase maturation protease